MAKPRKTFIEADDVDGWVGVLTRATWKGDIKWRFSGGSRWTSRITQRRHWYHIINGHVYERSPDTRWKYVGLDPRVLGALLEAIVFNQEEKEGG